MPTHVDSIGQDAPTDCWALIAAAQSGDMEAYDELYRRYCEVVFRFVLFRTGDRTLTEDLTAETFTRALRRITTVSYQGRDVGAWFVTIARNLIFDHVKSSRYKLEQSTGEMVDVGGATCGVEAEVIAADEYAALARAIGRLNADQRQCIELRFLLGLSVAEAAAIMERNVGAVKAMQHRAMLHLRRFLGESRADMGAGWSEARRQRAAPPRRQRAA